MPITRSALANIEDSVIIRFPGTSDTLEVWYKPESFTPEIQEAHNREQRRMQERAANRQQRIDEGQDVEDEDDVEDAGTVASVTMILDMVVRWDYLKDPTEDNQHPGPYPINRETVRSLGWRTINNIIYEMVAAISADPTKSRRTGNSSSPTAMRGTSRNG